MQEDVCFHSFTTDISQITPPSKFTFPFNYDPHLLSQIASQEIKERYLIPNYFNHDFGIEGQGMGKMFGVLVVKNKEDKLGYLCSFSGKIGEENKISGFVPPVFDILEIEGFFKKGEEAIVNINREIETLQSDADYQNSVVQLDEAKTEYAKELAALKQQHKENKELRKHKRKLVKSIPTTEEEKHSFLNLYDNESARDHYMMKDLKRKWTARIDQLTNDLSTKTQRINELKQRRKSMSAELQNKIFESFRFLNHRGEEKDLKAIFNVREEIIPPSGAGECAAPKLLQYAFLHGYKLVAMAEFWWGKTPTSEVRRHENYYPVCKSKCEPILKHMLQGIEMDTDPVLLIKQKLDLDIIYEDDAIMAINKPSDTLSVPGKKVSESIYDKIKELLPDATGPLNVHRLDMATSGVLLIAKNIEVYHYLQSQFTNRHVNKTYVALLDGVVQRTEGMIDLPLRVDLDDRPRQLVCYDYGKPAQTKYKVISIEQNKTRIHFYPITGRTHQLRVHASHCLGLNCPIVGDELYGKRSDRLYLHAASIEFRHPTTHEMMTITAELPF